MWGEGRHEDLLSAVWRSGEHQRSSREAGNPSGSLFYEGKRELKVIKGRQSQERTYFVNKYLNYQYAQEAEEGWVSTSDETCHEQDQYFELIEKL